MDAADAHLLYQSLQRSAKILHTCTRAAEAKAEGYCRLWSAVWQVEAPRFHFLKHQWGPDIFHSPEEDQVLLVLVLPQKCHQVVEFVLRPTDLTGHDTTIVSFLILSLDR